MVPQENTRRKLHILLPDVSPVRFQRQQGKGRAPAQIYGLPLAAARYRK